MIPDLRTSESWAAPVFWTIATMAIAWAVGHLVNAIAVPRITRWAQRTHGTWDEVVSRRTDDPTVVLVWSGGFERLSRL